MLTKTKKEQMLDAGGYPVYDKFGNERFKDVPYSHDDANVLHKVKGELDNVIQYDGGLGVPAGALSRQRPRSNRCNSRSTTHWKIRCRATLPLIGRLPPSQAHGSRRTRNGVSRGRKKHGKSGRFEFDFNGLEPGEKIAWPRARAAISSGCWHKANDAGCAANCRAKAVGIPQIATVHGQDAGRSGSSAIVI